VPLSTKQYKLVPASAGTQCTTGAVLVGWQHIGRRCIVGANWRRSSIANTCGCRCIFICGLSDVLINEYLFIYLLLFITVEILGPTFVCVFFLILSVFFGITLHKQRSFQALVSVKKSVKRPLSKSNIELRKVSVVKLCFKILSCGCLSQQKCALVFTYLKLDVLCF